METLENIMGSYDFGDDAASTESSGSGSGSDAAPGDPLDTELEWFQDRAGGEERTVYAALSQHCLTGYGKFLMRSLSTQKEWSEQRRIQADIRSLLADPKRLEHVRTQLSRLAAAEDNIRWHWTTTEDLKRNIRDNLLFDYPYNIGDYLNNQDWLLEILFKYKIFIHPLVTIVSPIISYIIALIFLMIYGMPFNWSMIWEILKFVLKFSMNNMSILSMGLYFLFYIYGIYQSIDDAIKTNKTIEELREKLVVFEDLENIAAELEMGEPFEGYRDFILRRDQMLGSGKTVKLFYQLCDKQECTKWDACLDRLAYLDVIQNCCALVESGWCLVEFCEEGDDCGKEEIRGMWNPIMGIDSIKNDCRLDKTEIITGPNASGKSTYLRAVGSCVRIAQALGVAPAVSMRIRPFDRIWTSFRVPDQQGELSLFEAELKRCQEIWETLADSGKNNRTLILLDEVMSSTNYIEGFSLSKALMLHLMKQPNCVCLLATHFHGLAKLAKKYPDNFRNASFETLVEPESGSLKFTYRKLEKANTKFTALDLVRDKGWIDPTLLDEAIAEKNRLTKKLKKTL